MQGVLSVSLIEIATLSSVRLAICSLVRSRLLPF
jgi:hypothetical protein